MGVQVNSLLKVSDNTGAFWVKCIKVPFKKKLGLSGDLILIALRVFISSKKVKKGLKYIALILTVSSWKHRGDLLYIKFFSNNAILFNNSYKQLGTRLYGVTSKEVKSRIRKKKLAFKQFQKVLSFSNLII